MSGLFFFAHPLYRHFFTILYLFNQHEIKDFLTKIEYSKMKAIFVIDECININSHLKPWEMFTEL